MGIGRRGALLIAALSALTPAATALLLALLGAIIGSYMATIALRWPAGRSASVGQSACDGCGLTLRWFELIPILSYVAARGYCRRCGAKIASLHLRIELCAAALGLVSASLYIEPISALISAVLFWQLLLLAVLDWRHLWLPDRLTIALAASGLALGGWVSDLPLTIRAAAMVGGFLTMELIRRGFLALRGKEGMGAGDPKMFGAIAAWTGPFALPFILMLAAVVGLAAALLALARRKQVDAFPFGTYLALATLLVLTAMRLV